MNHNGHHANNNNNTHNNNNSSSSSSNQSSHHEHKEREDFIVITEFSEREGPISPLTIPSDLPSEWKFNKSKFALRVLGSEFRKKKHWVLYHQ